MMSFCIGYVEKLLLRDSFARNSALNPAKEITRILDHSEKKSGALACQLLHRYQDFTLRLPASFHLPTVRSSQFQDSAHLVLQ